MCVKSGRQNSNHTDFYVCLKRLLFSFTDKNEKKNTYGTLISYEKIPFKQNSQQKNLIRIVTVDNVFAVRIQVDYEISTGMRRICSLIFFVAVITHPESTSSLQTTTSASRKIEHTEVKVFLLVPVANIICNQNMKRKEKKNLYISSTCPLNDIGTTKYDKNLFDTFRIHM